MSEQKKLKKRVFLGIQNPGVVIFLPQRHDDRCDKYKTVKGVKI